MFQIVNKAERWQAETTCELHSNLLYFITYVIHQSWLAS